MNAPPVNPAIPGHVLFPTAAIGSLALVLVAGLEWLGLLAAANEAIAARMGGEPARELPEIVVWLGAAAFSYGLAAVMLGSRAMWRRVILWVTAVALAAGWAPVMALAEVRPTVAGWIIGAIWTGVCALVYARNPLMPADDAEAAPAPAEPAP